MTSWQRTQIKPLPDQVFAHQPYLLRSPSRLNQGLSIPWVYTKQAMPPPLGLSERLKRSCLNGLVGPEWPGSRCCRRPG